jgi:hypothetical protein
MGVDDAKRLKTLEQENAKLKKLLVDRMLDIEADARARRAVPALRLPPHPHLPRPRRPSHERRPRAPALANVAPSGAA